jgi:hypothetical protein
MAQPGQISVSSRDYSAAASSSSSSSSSNHASFPVHEEDNQRFRQIEYRQPEIEYLQHQYIDLSHRGNYFAFDDLSAIRDCTWFCVVVVLTFCFFGLSFVYHFLSIIIINFFFKKLFLDQILDCSMLNFVDSFSIL